MPSSGRWTSTGPTTSVTACSGLASSDLPIVTAEASRPASAAIVEDCSWSRPVFLTGRQHCLQLARRRHILLRPQVADAAHDLLDQGEVRHLGILPPLQRPRLGPGSHDQGLRPIRCQRCQGRIAQRLPQVTPQFLGDEWREGMKQPQAGIQHPRQDRRGMPAGDIALHLLLGDLNVPVRKVRPEEVIDLAARLAILEGLEESFHVPHQLLQLGPDPGIGQCVFGPGAGARRQAVHGRDHKAAGVPQLVGEIAVGLHLLDGEVLIIPR